MTRTISPRRAQRAEDGILAVETALVIPTLLLVIALGVTLVVTMGAKMSALDASREAARLAARGESDTAALAAARRLAPSRSTIRLVDRAHWVEAVVKAEIRPFHVLPAFTVSASTLAEREDR